jgi:hypothetical protein
VQVSGADEDDAAITLTSNPSALLGSQPKEVSPRPSGRNPAANLDERIIANALIHTELVTICRLIGSNFLAMKGRLTAVDPDFFGGSS